MLPTLTQSLLGDDEGESSVTTGGEVTWDISVFVFAIKTAAPDLDWFKVLLLLVVLVLYVCMKEWKRLQYRGRLTRMYI